MTLAATVGVEIDDERLAKLEEFLDDLYLINQTTNLTRVPQDDAPLRHVADSMLVLPHLPQGGRVLDIGPGPGFPAWVIALLRPDLRVTALDSAGKAVRFMDRHPLPNLEARLQRAEEEVERESYDVVTGRAVAPFSAQIELSAAWVTVGGRFVPFRTPSEVEEIDSYPCKMLGLTLREKVVTALPETEVVRLFPVFEKTVETRPEYPRAWAKIKANPLRPNRV